ncbi:plastocyanin [Amaricoccus macauensis]|uniref:Plastocyanin n=1 Tax=Amaricoccus macauensis TaxID=57001 RepID=A0A840SMU1_9RHOB|nr:plastocyanin/azurin family copper-binding protein [Amaricoccus macauensis]MBB5221905.1 plastocyanin [Amaricoccus macauensis]
MILARREFLVGAVAVLALPARAAGPVEIGMRGDANGAHVWFDPVGLLVPPGTTVRWKNSDAGNAHTATAYDPTGLDDRPRRIPATASPWDSDYLLPGEEFEVMLTVPGVYDYCCIPHEHAGMVGRIVVGTVPADWHGWPDTGLPAAAVAAFPDAAAIVAQGSVRATGVPA